jgi:chromosome segregation ATPase
MKSKTQDGDLDRTDELPRLDVVAYEASLREGETLARTDNWAVGNLREAVRAEEAEAQAPSANKTIIRNWERPAPPRPPVTSDVDRILKRIAELEAEVASSGARNVDLELRIQALQTERAALEKRIVALEGDNARLTEYRTLALANVERLERQILESSEQHTGQLSELTVARTQEQETARRARELLEGQLAAATAKASEIDAQRTQLKLDLESALELGLTRAQSIEELQRMLDESERTSARLGRSLAAKLAEHDALSTTVERRNATIAMLQHARDELTLELQRAVAKNEQLDSSLAENGRLLNDVRESLTERQRQIANRDDRIAQLIRDVERLSADLQVATQQHQLAQEALSHVKERHENDQRALAERKREIEDLRDALQRSQTDAGNLQRDLLSVRAALAKEQEAVQISKESFTAEAQARQAVSAELEKALSSLQQLTAERDELMPLREELTERAADLERTFGELVRMRQDADALRAQFATQAATLAERERELALSRDDMMHAKRGHDDLVQLVEDLQEKVVRLETEVAQQNERLQAKSAELAAARRELNEALPQVRGLEQALRARDELADNLRSELQKVQDEQGSMNVQLEKARARHKSMAQEVFQRDTRIAELKSDLAVHTEALAAIRRDVGRMAGEPEAPKDSEPLRMLEPLGHEGIAIVLDRKIMTIGRTAESDICIPSKLVSRKHARLLIGPNGVIIEDAGSTNGCYVNNYQVKQQLMRDGDVLLVGDLKYRLTTRSGSTTRIRDNVLPLPEPRRS